MLNFVFILTIIFEIALTAFCVLKLIEAQKKVEVLHGKVIAYSKVIFEKSNEIISVVKKINKVIAIFSNKKFAITMSILKIGFIVIQTLIFIKTFKFSSSFVTNLKKMKKLLYIQIAKEMIKLVCKYL